MSSFKVHCARTEAIFGKPYKEVHRWLDGKASDGRGRMNMNHRRYRHHIEGVQTIREMYGDEAAEVAIQHILDDEGAVQTREYMESVYPAKPEWISFKSLNG